MDALVYAHCTAAESHTLAGELEICNRTDVEITQQKPERENSATKAQAGDSQSCNRIDAVSDSHGANPVDSFSENMYST